MLVALRRLPGGDLLVSDDDGYTTTLSLEEWRMVLKLATGKQRAAVERIVAERAQLEVTE